MDFPISFDNIKDEIKYNILNNNLKRVNEIHTDYAKLLQKKLLKENENVELCICYELVTHNDMDIEKAYNDFKSWRWIDIK
jgi:hypothetical protein